jgi:hypothetical protein
MDVQNQLSPTKSQVTILKGVIMVNEDVISDDMETQTTVVWLAPQSLAVLHLAVDGKPETPIQQKPSNKLQESE